MAKKRRKVARKAQRPAGGDGAGPPRKAQRLADDSGVDAVGAAEGGPPLAEALRAELRPLKLRALTKRAEAAGVDDDSLDAAEDAASVIELIVAKETAPTTQAAAEATRGEEEELGVSLPSLDMLLKAQSQNSKPGWTDDADEYIVAYVVTPAKGLYTVAVICIACHSRGVWVGAGQPTREVGEVVAGIERTLRRPTLGVGGTLTLVHAGRTLGEREGRMGRKAQEALLWGATFGIASSG